MNQNYISTEQLYYGILAGANEVVSAVDELNSINVFPVPDKDTGTNMARTMQEIINGANLATTIKDTLKSIAFCAINGARGNSGTIFAQYFYGLFESSKPTTAMTVDEFSMMSEHATKKAYSSIDQPEEGTILTVMTNFSSTIANAKSSSFKDAISNGYHSASKSLAATTDMLPQLKKANVVDAGANGFVYFLKGIVAYFNSNVTVIPRERLKEISPDFEAHDPNIHSGRYCCEFTISDLLYAKNEIKEHLKPLGNELIMAGGDERMHIHIHSNHPDKVASVLYNTSKVIHQKIDDMQLQIAVSKDPRSICIVTDSIADLPILRELTTPVPVIPANIIIREQEYVDRLTIHNHSVIEALDLGLNMSSSAPNHEVTHRYFELLDRHYDHIVIITVSKAMSGTYQHLLRVAEEWKGHSTIHVIDSRRNSAAQGLVVMKAVTYSMNTSNVDDLLMYVDALINRTNIFVAVDDLKGMIHGGRIPVTLGRFLNKIGVKPIVSIDDAGKGILFGSGLSRKQTENQIIKKLVKIHKEQEIVNYCIVYSSYDERVDAFAKRIEEILNRKPAYSTPISSIVAMNTSRGAVAVGYTTRRIKQ